MSADLIPWSSSVSASPRVRYSALVPGVGYHAALPNWQSPDGPIDVWWEPVVCFAVKTVEGNKDDDGDPEGEEEEDDTVVPLLRGEFSSHLSEAGEVGSNMSNGYFEGLHTEAEKADPGHVASLLKDAEDRRRQMIASAAEEAREHSDVAAFIKAQADPAGFARAMRQHATSRSHAWYAIMLAGGDPKQALENSRQHQHDLWQRWHARPKDTP